MDTVMVLSVLNGGLPISTVVENGTDMRRNGTSNDKSEIAGGATNSLTDSLKVWRKDKPLLSGKGRESIVMGEGTTLYAWMWWKNIQ